MIWLSARRRKSCEDLRSFAAAQPNVSVREVVYGILWDLACVDGSISAEELENVSINVPNVQYYTVEEAQKTLAETQKSLEAVTKEADALRKELIDSSLDKIIASDGQPESIPQEELEGKFKRLYDAPKIFKDICEIDWKRPSKRIYDFIRGLSPYPGAWTTLMGPDGKAVDLKIFKTTKTEKNPGMRPGMIFVYKGVLYITTGDFLLQIDELQLAGKTRMKARDFLNGNKNIEKYIIK